MYDSTAAVASASSVEYKVRVPLLCLLFDGLLEPEWKKTCCPTDPGAREGEIRRWRRWSGE